MTYEPDRIVQGSSLQWKKSLPSYSETEGWTLTYSFVNADNQFTITATNQADGFHTVDVPPTTTINYVPGEYKWQSYAAKGTERIDIATGTMTVEPDFATSTGLDARSHVKTVLDALEAMLLGKASKDQLSYTIQGRSISRLTPTEIIQWLDVYRREYNRELEAERLQKGRGPTNKLLVRFRENI